MRLYTLSTMVTSFVPKARWDVSIHYLSVSIICTVFIVPEVPKGGLSPSCKSLYFGNFDKMSLSSRIWVCDGLVSRRHHSKDTQEAVPLYDLDCKAESGIPHDVAYWMEASTLYPSLLFFTSFSPSLIYSYIIKNTRHKLIFIHCFGQPFRKDERYFIIRDGI